MRGLDLFPQMGKQEQIGGFVPGDLCWVWNNDTLWPCIVLEKEIKSTRKTSFSVPEPTWKVAGIPQIISVDTMTEYQVDLNKRLASYGCDRFEYKVTLLPLPNPKETILEIRDYDLYPFNYTTEPLPMDDSSHYNRGLIQAIQIQSSWAVPNMQIRSKEELVQKEIKFEPPIRNPIHIGCPSVSG